MKNLKMTFEIVDQNGIQLEDLGEQEVTYNEINIDIEYELVHDGNGSPSVRPKTPPKY